MLLVLCLSVGVGSTVAADKLVVGIWDTNQQKGLQEILNDWTKESGIPAEIQVTTWDEYWTVLEAGATGGTFLLRQSFMGLPKDLEEAAKLDGCNIGQTFLYIMLPLTRSNMIALGIFTSVFAYKDLLWPMIAAPRNESTTLAAALAKMQGQYVSNFPELMAASLLACLPMVVLYVLFQRQFIEGIATTGGKL